MSENFRLTVRFDLLKVVTSMYDLREIAAAMAALPWTTACSPYTIVLPGAETRKGGASGLECLRSCMGIRLVPFAAGVLVPFVVGSTTVTCFDCRRVLCPFGRL